MSLPLAPQRLARLIRFAHEAGPKAALGVMFAKLGLTAPPSSPYSSAPAPILRSARQAEILVAGASDDAGAWAACLTDAGFAARPVADESSHELGATLASHPDVRLVAFAGRTPTNEEAAAIQGAFSVQSLVIAAKPSAANDLAPFAPVPANPSALRIDWIVPRLLIGGGGHRNIIRAAHHLQIFGHAVTLHFLDSDDQADQLPDLVRQHFYPFEGEVRAYGGVFRRSDFLFATHWTTVEPALRAKATTGEIIYFVQDFEPLFYPMGSEYILAENTYRQGLYCITSGPWCERVLKRDFGAEADHFRFPVDRAIYQPAPRTDAKRRVLFFAKPEMPRRCFELGLMALRALSRLRPDVEIVLFGSNQIAADRLGFPAKLVNVAPTLADLNKLYASADIGLVFSTTNPSLVPYEMMASGLVVADLDRLDAAWNYDGRRDLSLLCDPRPDMMARQLDELRVKPAELSARRERGLAFAATFPDETAMARRIESLILARVKAENRSL